MAASQRTNYAHEARVRTELIEAGMTRYGLSKMSTRYLYKLIHEDEHIHGVVYGRIDHLSVMLVATNLRILYVNRSPFFTATDEFRYDTIPAIKSKTSGFFTSLTLHTRIGDYPLKYVNAKCATKFTNYIERRRIESQNGNDKKYEDESPVPLYTAVKTVGDKEAINFLTTHDTAVLSTVDHAGRVRGAVVHYVVDIKNRVYVITKSETAKAKGAFGHGQVALTIHEAGTLKTLQLEGLAEVEQNLDMKGKVFERIVTLRPYKEGLSLPPVTRIKDGSFVVLRITPDFIRFSDYSKNPTT